MTVSNEPSAPAAPAATLSGTERQPLVDALRGFALLGILVVNIASFASTHYGMGLPDPLAVSLPDRIASFVRALLFETKFYLLFSFLFGYSFTLQMRAAEREGRAFGARMARRLAALWLIGVAHAVLLYYGDILTTYAVLGALLLMLRQRGDGFLVGAAVALVLAFSLLWAGVGYLFSHGGAYVISPAMRAEAADAMEAYRATPATVVAQHLVDISRTWWITALVQAPQSLAMFLFGLVAGRRALLADARVSRGALWRVLGWGLLVGLPGAVVFAYPTLLKEEAVREVQSLAATLLTGPFLTAAYVAGMLLFFQTPLGGRVARLLAPAGRMALTNYLLQSAVCAWIFLAYGLRWIGEVGPLASMLIALAIFAGNLALSGWWMRRFAYGPVEWLLRAATHLRRPPLRRTPPA